MRHGEAQSLPVDTEWKALLQVWGKSDKKCNPWMQHLNKYSNNIKVNKEMIMVKYGVKTLFKRTLRVRIKGQSVVPNVIIILKTEFNFE